jgi:hypothetical protein
MGFPNNIAIILRILGAFSKYFMQFLEISCDFGILGFSKIWGFFQRFFGIFDEVYGDFQSNLSLGTTESAEHDLSEVCALEEVDHCEGV